MNRKAIRWGLIGTGDIAKKRVAAALQALAPSGELAAVASRNVSQAEEFAHRHGIQKVFGGVAGLINEPSVDAVYIATPVHLHEPMAIAAAKAGKHVLCEKPMAMTYAGCRRMIRSCREAHVRLGIAYYRRFYPLVRSMRHLLDAGTIGRVIHAHVFVAEKFNPVGSRAPRRWLVQKKFSGGGPMMDFGCHRIDLLIYLLGDVRSVNAVTRNLSFSNRDVEDHATALLTFRSQDGRIPGAVGEVTASHCLDQGEDQFELFGTEGKLVAPDLRRGLLRVVTRAGEEELHLPPPANPHFPLVEDFTRALFEDRDPVVSGHEGAKTSRVMDEIYGRA